MFLKDFFFLFFFKWIKINGNITVLHRKVTEQKTTIGSDLCNIVLCKSLTYDSFALLSCWCSHTQLCTVYCRIQVKALLSTRRTACILLDHFTLHIPTLSNNKPRRNLKFHSSFWLLQYSACILKTMESTVLLITCELDQTVHNKTKQTECWHAIQVTASVPSSINPVLWRQLHIAYKEK